jgi:hypothetical protein
MSTMPKAMIAGFTAAERNYIRGNLDQVFSTLPTVADGFLLKNWRSGPQAGQPKMPLSAKGLIERGLMRIDSTQHLPRLLFTEAGLVALRTTMTDRRLADSARYALFARNSASHRVPVQRPRMAVNEDTGVDRGATLFRAFGGAQGYRLVQVRPQRRRVRSPVRFSAPMRGGTRKAPLDPFQPGRSDPDLSLTGESAVTITQLEGWRGNHHPSQRPCVGS